MRNGAFMLVASLALTLPGHAEAVPHGDPQVMITINPEGRVTAAIEGALPSSAPCDVPIEIGVEIVNQGFATARLEAQLVGNPPASARIDFHPEPLRGVPHETRTLRITLTSVAPTDMTIAFGLHGQVPDLGGLDRIHVLMRGR